ncbi:carbohydrate ABC transporter permease [Streptomyces sp. NP160]|uniref:carbohydrate ABC transporter permease n=1 Tax=Streptomyces sp. NP160 TaxID=2586637 RepID=UPI0035A5A9B1
MSATTPVRDHGRPATPAEADARPRRSGGASRWVVPTVLTLGALAFLLPFYLMVIGSLQAEPDTSISGLVPSGGLTTQNYANIDGSIDLWRTLLNSGVITGGAVVGTLVFGVLAGYALAVLHFRGRGTLFAMVLLVQVIPFQLLTIPLYVLTVRTYGLADNYLGMVLPFLINTTAVFVFRQFFLQLPPDLFSAARIDGASELRVLWSVALPLVRPALLTVVLLTFIGPWNEFLWPFLVTKEASMQPLAVALANYQANVAATTSNPYGAVLAGSVVLAAPAVGLFLVFQRHFTATNLSAGVKG